MKKNILTDEEIDILNANGYSDFVALAVIALENSHEKKDLDKIAYLKKRAKELLKIKKQKENEEENGLA